MSTTKKQTEALLHQFNKNFEQSRQEMIDRFLEDQQQLNLKFKEYALDSDHDGEDCDKNIVNNKGITYDCLSKHYGGKHANDDTESVTSVMTQCSFSDYEDHGKKRSIKGAHGMSARRRQDQSKDQVNKASLQNDIQNRTDTQSQIQRPQSASKSKEEVCQRLSLSTPRFGVPERKGLPFSRSKSVRAPSKTPMSPVLNSKAVMKTHPEQPPNSPEEVRKNASESVSEKPPIDGIQTGRRALDKRERPKKLLTKRSVRPKTAMGIQSNEISPLLPETEPINQERLQCQPNPSWDSEMVRAGLVRSAPIANRNRLVSWDLEDTSTGESSSFSNRRNSIGKSKVPPLPMSVASKSDNSNNPSYASTYENPDKKKVSKSSSINSNSKSSSNNKQFIKSGSEYFPMSHIDVTGSIGLAMEAKKVKGVTDKTTTLSNKPLGSLRRYKGQSDLNKNESSTITPGRGPKVAVLKLPPVSKKKHTPSDTRSSTSLGYFRNDAPM